MKCIHLVVATFLGTRLLANLPEDPAEYRQWEATSLANIEQYKANPTPENIGKLGTIVRKMSLPFNKEVAEPVVSTAAKEALISIPGHAKYYADRILDARTRFEEKRSKGEYANMNEPVNEQQYGFETLAQLPSPETVQVLCEMVDDWRGYVAPEHLTLNDIEGGSDSPVNGGAIRALRALPIRSKPFRYVKGGNHTLDDFKAEIAAWKGWYQEIKDGKRTFSFEGDPIEYNFSGPARVSTGDATRSAAHKESLPANPVASVSSVASGPFYWMLGGSLAALSAGGWFAFRKQRGDSSNAN